MLTGILRTIILFFVTTVVLRLMGKRQLAQLQPYEVVITLMISDLATQPMGDVEIPLLGGLIAILTLLTLAIYIYPFGCLVRNPPHCYYTTQCAPSRHGNSN